MPRGWPSAVVGAARGWWRRWFGTRSEQAAARFLRRLGHRVIARNWRCDLGELDLVTRIDPWLVFVEVRSTTEPTPDHPLASVDRAKQRRLTLVARAFLRRYGLENCVCRFDVIAISWPPEIAAPEIVHIPNAFDAVG